MRPACPICSMEEVLTHDDHFECSTCGHEWAREVVATAEPSDTARVVKDAVGNVLADGDTVTVVKDLKIKGSSTVIKVGTKVRGIRLVNGVGDHDIDCKVDGVGPMQLKSSVVKKI